MRLTDLAATNEIVRVHGVAARVWIGRTANGTRVHLLVCGINIPTEDPRTIKQAETELSALTATWEGDMQTRWVGALLIATYGASIHVSACSSSEGPAGAGIGAPAEGGSNGLGLGGASSAAEVMGGATGAAGASAPVGDGGAGSVEASDDGGAPIGGAAGEGGTSGAGGAAGEGGAEGDLYTRLVEATEAGCVVVQLDEPGLVYLRAPGSGSVIYSFGTEPTERVWFATESNQQYEIDSTSPVIEAFVVMVPRHPKISADGMRGSGYLFAGFRDGKAPANVAALWALSHLPPNDAAQGQLKITITPSSDVRAQLELLGSDETPVDGAVVFHGTPGAPISLIKGRLKAGEYLVRVSNWGPDPLPLGGTGDLPAYATDPYALEWSSK